MRHRHDDDVLDYPDPEFEVRYLPAPRRRVTLFEGVVSSLVRGVFGALVAVALLVVGAVLAVVLFFAAVGWGVDQIPDGPTSTTQPSP